MQAEDIQRFLGKGGIIVRLRGLPYGCTADQILYFFRNGDNGSEVADGEDGILFIRRNDGRSTGDAFVQFASKAQVDRAMTKHKELIGTRYIELFTSTPSEVEQVIKKANAEPKPKAAAQVLAAAPPVPMVPPLTLAPLATTTLLPLPQHVITSGTRRDCLRLRGLPYEAQVEHILDFLGESAVNIVLQGVHMVYNPQGQPSGEAFIQMDTEASANQAATHCHRRIMSYGKKERYVEVFQCSGEDMHQILTSGQQKTPLAAGTAGADPELTYLPYYDPYILNQVALHHHFMAKRSYVSPYLPDIPESKLKPSEQDFLPYLMPRLLPPNPSTLLPKPGYPMIVAPTLPQMGVLGMKRSWDQAFPLDTAQAQKRWKTSTVPVAVPGYPPTGYFPEA